MSFSHVGLTVSDIAKSVSFYAAALQPLKIKYIGQEGRSHGFGITSADFFITQAAPGTRISPSHVAFHANTKSKVRQCHTAALRAHGYSEGSPEYRNDDCACYNAVVEDLDGHKIEFIYRQPHPGHSSADEYEVNNHSRGLRKQIDYDQDANDYYAPSHARSTDEVHQRDELAPHPGITRANTSPAISSKNMLGLGVAAAAGAAIVYSFVSSERQSARDESDFQARSNMSVRRESIARTVETLPTTVPVQRVESQRPRHRNFSTTESNYSARRSHRQLVLEEGAFDEPEELPTVYADRRITTRVRREPEEVIYVPASDHGRSESYTIRRAQTMPIEEYRTPYLLEAAPSTTSKRSSHQQTPRSIAAPSHHSSRHVGNSSEDKLSRHDSGVSMHSSARSKSSHRHRRSEHDRIPEDTIVLHEDHAPSSISTIRPSRRESVVKIPTSRASSHVDAAVYYPAAVPLPPSVDGYTASRASSSRRSLRPDSHYESAIEVITPESIASGRTYHTVVTASGAARVPLPDSHADWEEENYDDLGHLSDDITEAELAPNDSISCVDFSTTSRRRHRRHRTVEKSSATASSSRREGEEAHGSERTVRSSRKIGGSASGSKHSAMTLPVRIRDRTAESPHRSSRRSVNSYA